MKTSLLSLLVVSSLLLTVRPAPAQDTAAAFAAAAASRAEAAPAFGLAGDAPGWLFLADDAAHAGKGEFWKAGPVAALPIITKFRESLSASGITLILAPVPSKASVYPDKFIAGTAPAAAPPLAPFLKQLETTGAMVVDLDTPFREHRDGKDPVFCATDSHWSPAGLTLAAGLIADRAAEIPALASLLKPGAYLTSAPQTLAITGDLAAAPGLESTAREELTLTKIGTGEAAAPVPVPAAEAGPVILMGDSHTMVFTDGASLGMHCQGAGLRDQLQARFGFPLIQLSNQNSGGTGARRLLAQRQKTNPDYLKEVKAVIWVFSVREFTMAKWR